MVDKEETSKDITKGRYQVFVNGTWTPVQNASQAASLVCKLLKMKRGSDAGRSRRSIRDIQGQAESRDNKSVGRKCKEEEGCGKEGTLRQKAHIKEHKLGGQENKSFFVWKTHCHY